VDLKAVTSLPLFNTAISHIRSALRLAESAASKAPLAVNISAAWLSLRSLRFPRSTSTQPPCSRPQLRIISPFRQVKFFRWTPRISHRDIALGRIPPGHETSRSVKMSDSYSWPAAPFEQRYGLEHISPPNVQQQYNSATLDPTWIFGYQENPTAPPLQVHSHHSHSLETEMPHRWQIPSDSDIQMQDPMPITPVEGTNSHSLHIRDVDQSSVLPRPSPPEVPRYEAPVKPTTATPATATRKPIEGDCPVCWEAFLPDQTVLYCRTTCGNNFHRTCFVDWVTTPKNRATPNAVRCPMCRGMWDEEELRQLQMENGITPSRGIKKGSRRLDRLREAHRMHRRRSMEQNGGWSRVVNFPGRPTLGMPTRMSVDLSRPRSPHVTVPTHQRYNGLPQWSLQSLQQAQVPPTPNNGGQNISTQHNQELPRFQMPQPLQNNASNPVYGASGSGWVTLPYQHAPQFGVMPQTYEPMRHVPHGHPVTQPSYRQQPQMPQVPHMQRYAETPTFNTMLPQQQQQQQHPCPAMRNPYHSTNELPAMNYNPEYQDLNRPYTNGTFQQQQQQQPYEYVQYHFSQTYTAWHG
jgi:hypothetical protein